MSRLEAEKEELEKELDTQTNQTHKQVKGWYFYILCEERELVLDVLVNLCK